MISKNGISRRRFGILTGSLLAGMALSWWKWRTNPFEELVLENTRFLNLAPGTAWAFSRDFKKQFVGNHGQDRWKDYLRRLKERTDEFPLADFLMSTDFFLNGEDESVIVRYVKLYDPTSGCRNPFARFE